MTPDLHLFVPADPNDPNNPQGMIGGWTSTLDKDGNTVVKILSAIPPDSIKPGDFVVLKGANGKVFGTYTVGENLEAVFPDDVTRIRCDQLNMILEYYRPSDYLRSL